MKGSYPEYRQNFYSQYEKEKQYSRKTEKNIYTSPKGHPNSFWIYENLVSPLAIGKMKMKATMICGCLPTRMTKIDMIDNMACLWWLCSNRNSEALYLGTKIAVTYLENLSLPKKWTIPLLRMPKGINSQQ